MEFEKLFDEVSNLDDSIRYAVILSYTGEKIFGGYKEGISPLLDSDELKMIHFYAGQRWDTRKNLAHKIGMAKYAMAEYDKLKRMTFPIDDKHLLLITTEVKNEHQKIINAVLDVIKKHSENEASKK